MTPNPDPQSASAPSGASLAPATGSLCSSYWPLFDHMAANHELTLTDSELEDICRVVEKMRPRLLSVNIPGDLVVMAALEAMEGGGSQVERARFTERLTHRMKAREANHRISGSDDPAPKP